MSKNKYYTLNPFAKADSDGLEILNTDFIKKKQNSNEEDYQFDVEEEEGDGLVKIEVGEKKYLISGIVKEKIVDGIKYEIDRKLNVKNKIQLAMILVLWLFMVVTIIPQNSIIMGIKVFISFMLGFYASKICLNKSKISLEIKDKKICVNKLELPITIIKSISIAQKNKIIKESEVSIGLASDYLLMESFNKVGKELEIDKSGEYKLIATLEDKDYVILNGLNKEQVSDMYNELTM